MSVRCDQVVVIGGSMAGLLTARVLSNYFAQVTLIERDALPDSDAHRAGVPQARHTHGLLLRGLRLLDHYFPGFKDELAASGAVRIHWMRDTIQLVPSGWTPRFDSGIITYLCSRPHLEALVRRRVRALPNVQIMDGWEVERLIAEGDRVVGVDLLPRPRRGEGGRQLRVDLVVDASGRGSRTPEWLRAIGFDAPSETQVDAKLGYASQYYRMPADFQPDWSALLMMTTPAIPRGGVFQRNEGGIWGITLAGVNGDYPPTDFEALKAFARAIPAPMLHDALDRAEPITPVYGYHRTGNLLRHYEKLARFPEGFLVLGDAVCAFNPVYGQGMTAAALGAETLDRWLKDGGRDGRRFQAALAKVNQSPWQMATNEDWRYPGTEGEYPGKIVERLNGYVDWLFDAAPDVPEVAQTFLGVMHLVMPPLSLFRPALIWKRVRWGRKRVRGTARSMSPAT